MILIDTSVWIDFFSGASTPHAAKFEQLITDDENIALCGIIVTEILQGVSEDATYKRVHKHLEALIMLPMTEQVFIRAANIYRVLRKKGITVRKSNDCIIAATALEHRCPLLHNNKDFSAITKHFPLKIVEG